MGMPPTTSAGSFCAKAEESGQPARARVMLSDQAVETCDAAWPISVRGILWAIFIAIVAHIIYVLFLEDYFVQDNSAAALGRPESAAKPPFAPSEATADWKLASVVKDKSNAGVYLRVSTRVRHGELGFRMEGALDASVTELVSLARETDLMPSWNAYCAAGEVVRLTSPLELWAFADFKYWPLPIPPMYVAIHATLEERRPRQGGGGGEYFCAFESPSPSGPAAFDRSKIPESVQRHAEVIVPSAKATLTALPVAPGAAPRTGFDAEILMDLSRLSFLGLARNLHPPQWMVTTIVSVLMPTVWKTVLKTVANLHADGGGAIGERILRDETGVYTRIRKATGQVDVAVNRVDGPRDGSAPSDSQQHQQKRSKWSWF